MRIPVESLAARLPRVPLPGFVRRRPFPWALGAAIVAGWIAVLASANWEYGVPTHWQQALNYLLQAAGLVLPLAVAAAWWRRIGAWARGATLLVCGAWSLFALFLGAQLVGNVRAFARGAPVVDQMLREPLRAMETPPESAAARALARGDTSFLGMGGECIGIPGVDTTTARRHGVRVVSGTFHDGEPLTGKHRAFLYSTTFYAFDYNGTILAALGMERGGSGCVDPRDFRRADRRFFWP